jgi:UDP-N-acetylmuramate dehydrogenase
VEINNLKCEFKLNEPLSKHTSFGIGGPADILVYPANRDDIIAVLKDIRRQGINYFILGSGTNLLVRDGGFRGAAISLQRMNTIRIEREYRSIGGAFALVQADAGASLAKLLSFTVEEGLAGIEFAAGIPGTVGGAICMNAGTASGEIGDVIESVIMLSPDGEVISRGSEDMEFGYRTSLIPEGHLVIEARIALRRGDKVRIQAKVKELLDKRHKQQPLGLPNAGSMFKNPQEESAGKLIESAGLKGRSIGDAQVLEKHANFIVNRGKATAAQVLALMDMVIKTVLDVHGIRLEPEIKILGED